MIAYLVLKTVHILSATILFGTGLGTAFHMWMTHLRGDVPSIASTARNVVIADWLFTATSGIVQPVTGTALLMIAGYDPLSSWLVMAYVLYAIAGICWVLVVRLQLKVAQIAGECSKTGASLPEEYQRSMRTWFWLGWPAFISLIGVFWLMIAKPRIWGS